MKTLILMRHAKSSWGTPGIDDRDRPLNRRGKAAAPVMAEWLARQGLLPALILCSPARRTRQTVKRMRKAVPGLPEPVILAALYHAMPEQILDAVRQAPTEAGVVMVVAHEPGLGALARQLIDATGSPHGRDALAQFPTAAMAVFEPEISDWRGLALGQARLTAFARPRDLMERPAAGS